MPTTLHFGRICLFGSLLILNSALPDCNLRHGLEFSGRAELARGLACARLEDCHEPLD